MSARSNNNVIQKRLRPLYTAAFFQGFVFWYAVEKLFMKSLGISDAGIAAIVIIFTLVMMVANVPCGILADRWSRKGVLLVATLSLVAGTAIDGMSHGFVTYLIGSCLWGIYYACYMGTYDSIVYDVLLEETGEAVEFARYYGRIQLYDGLALVASSLLSGVLVHRFNLRAVYFATIPLSCLALIALWRFNEPKLHKAVGKSLLGTHIREVLHAVLHRREVLWITLSIVCITIAERITLEFDQLWLIALALPLVLYGPVNALLLAAYGASGLAAKGLSAKRWLLLLCSILLIAAGASMLFHVLALTVAAIFVLIGGLMALNIIIGRWLHDTLPSNIRAGASSAVVTIGYGVFLPMGLLLGIISRRASIFQASWIIIVVCTLLFLTVLLASRKATNNSLHLCRR